VEKKERLVPTPKEADATAENEDQMMHNASDHRLTMA
jgi:hypothetical protein